MVPERPADGDRVAAVAAGGKQPVRAVVAKVVRAPMVSTPPMIKSW
jgi:hypothetical protein